MSDFDEDPYGVTAKPNAPWDLQIAMPMSPVSENQEVNLGEKKKGVVQFQVDEGDTGKKMAAPPLDRKHVEEGSVMSSDTVLGNEFVSGQNLTGEQQAFDKLSPKDERVEI